MSRIISTYKRTAERSSWCSQMQQRPLARIAVVLLLATAVSSAIAPATSSNANQLLRPFMHQLLEAAQQREDSHLSSFLSPSRNLILPWDVGTLAVKSAFDDTIRNSLESLRKVLVVAFEPLEVDRVPLDIDTKGIISKGYLKDVAIHQLSEFKIDEVQSNIERLFIRLGITFDELDLYGYYDVDAKVNNHLHVFGNGTMKMRAYELKINASTRFAYRDQHFQVKDLTIQIGLKKAKILMDNLLGGGPVGEVTNAVLGDVLPAYIEEFREEISERVSAAATKAINDKLASFSLDDILDMAGVPKPQPKPPLHS